MIRLPDAFRLDSKVAVVTGGAGTIGKSLCRGLAEVGAAVICASRNLDACKAVADGITADGGKAFAIRLDLADTDSIDRFFDEEWKVAPEADRMGYRFRGGTPLEFNEREQPFGAGSDPSNIVDSCYPYGSVQVPGGTEPIILHRDAVSGGGYFMIGTVISADMDLIGQLQPNTPARFRRVTMEQALEARHARAAMLDRLRKALQ